MLYFQRYIYIYLITSLIPTDEYDPQKEGESVKYVYIQIYSLMVYDINFLSTFLSISDSIYILLSFFLSY